MRITGGSLLGRRIEVPKGIIRPAMDKMRESVFAILGDISGKSFLDLFSGSGIIALEASSRGAVTIEAVEKDAKKSSTILTNVKISPVRIGCHFIAVELYIKRAKQAFDYIFCDPPFPYQFKFELVSAIAASPLMKENSMLILHHPREERLNTAIQSLNLVDHREYGRSLVEFWKSLCN
ncbi:methyltransferase [Spirochaetia bacterium]|nr:methyltransferase [Spirochaetia bacterium]